MNKQDALDIQMLFSRTIEGGNFGDGDVFAEVYSKEWDFMGFNDTYINGKSQVARFHSNLFAYLIFHIVGKIRSIVFVAPMVAIVIDVSGTI